MSGLVLGDWGTSRLRLILIEGGGAVLRRVDGPGIGGLLGQGADAVGAALDAALAELDPGKEAQVVLCGMAGARSGLIEVPYAACPAGVAEWARGAARTERGGYAVSVAAGLRCANFVGAPDVMRGEETQIFGALTIAPELARGRHILALPGTHSKWVALVDGVIERFHTFFTGELFALLRDRSTLLRVHVGVGGGDGAGDAAGGLAAGIARGQNGAGLAASLFETRAAQLLDRCGPAWAEAFLSGLLIADEVRAATALTVAPSSVTLIGDPGLCERYTVALTKAGIAVRTLDGDACALAGLQHLAVA